MELSLTHDPHGYYMKRDVFNKKGDFITSPEISQMFGEMLGFWVIHFFSKIGFFNVNSPQKSEKVSLVEFGPGRGTLMKDIVRVLFQFNFMKKIEINFVEASPFLQKEQQENLKKLMKEHDIWLKYEVIENKNLDFGKGQASELLANNDKLTKCERLYNEELDISFTWYHQYESYLSHHQALLSSPVSAHPPVLFLCHEFFDALPIMLFERLPQGWVEKLVDINPELNSK